jgi:hypothetical protein
MDCSLALRDIRSSNAFLGRIPASEFEELLIDHGEIEQYWHEEFNKFHRVHLVVLSEAPLFGARKKYIYNPQAGASVFFNFEDYKHTFGDYGPELALDKGLRKHSLLSGLCECGVLFVDLFPLPLNDSSTVKYSQLSLQERTELFHAVSENFFRLKLKLILDKLADGALFVFRYERVREACAGLIQVELASCNIEPVRLVPKSIGDRLGTIRRDQLRDVYERAISA